VAIETIMKRAQSNADEVFEGILSGIGTIFSNFA